MPGCPAITFEGVTPEAWTCMTTRARGVGIPITSDSGTASAQGISVDYRYDARASTVTFTVTELPGGVDCGGFEAKLREAVGACTGTS